MRYNNYLIFIDYGINNINKNNNNNNNNIQ